MGFFNRESKMSLGDFQKMAVVTALKDMFKSHCFSICDVDKCLKITGVIPPTEIYDALSAIHCVHWSEMDPIFREEVFAQTLGLFKHSGFDLDKINTMELFEDKKTGKRVYKLLSDD